MGYKATMAGVNQRRLNRIKGLVKEIEVSLINNNVNHPIHEQFVLARLNDIKILVEELKKNTPNPQKI